MKRKQKAVFALVVLAATVLMGVFPMDGGVLYLLAAPLIHAGQLLRRLSLSGGFGNGAAIALYGILCLCPLLLKGKRKWQREDWLLVLASGVLLYVMYGLINPGTLPVSLAGSVGQVQLCFAEYSVLVAWGILKLLRASDRVRQENLYKTLRVFLMICAAELIAAGIGLGWQAFQASLNEVREGNTWPGTELWPTYVFLLLSFAATSVEYVLDAAVMLSGVGLLRELERDAYSEGCVAAADRTAMWCKRALAAATLMTLVLNLGQVLCAAWLRNMETSLRLPVFSLGIAFVALALTRLLNQGRQLKEDNDLFI